MPVPAGIYRPLFAGENDLKEIPVAGFQLAATPVTNGEFLDFVRANPQWRRSQVKRLFADENYLKHWAGDTELGPACDAAQPVTLGLVVRREILRRVERRPPADDRRVGAGGGRWIHAGRRIERTGV